MTLLGYGISLTAAYKVFRTFSKSNDVLASGATSNIVNTLHKGIRKKQLDKIDDAVSLKNDLLGNLPSVENTVSTTVSTPSNFKDYLQINNDLIASLIEQQRNTVSQLEQMNVLTVERIKISTESESHLQALSETLNNAFPAIVNQLQELTKLPSILSMSNEVNIAYRELGLKNHETLINTLNGLTLTSNFASDSINLAPVINVSNDVAVPSIINKINIPDTSTALGILSTATANNTTALTGIKNNLTSVSQNAIKQKEIADYMTSSKKLSDYEIGFNTEITLSDGSVEMSSHTPLEIHMMNSLKSHEIADYKTTPLNVYNFDGSLVTSYIKPIELEVVKNSVEAKNNSDEMEYKVPDDVMNEMFSLIPLPTFTKSNWEQDQKDILTEIGIGSL